MNEARRVTRTVIPAQPGWAVRHFHPERFGEAPHLSPEQVIAWEIKYIEDADTKRIGDYYETTAITFDDEVTCDTPDCVLQDPSGRLRKPLEASFDTEEAALEYFVEEAARAKAEKEKRALKLVRVEATE